MDVAIVVNCMLTIIVSLDDFFTKVQGHRGSYLINVAMYISAPDNIHTLDIFQLFLQVSGKLFRLKMV